MNFAGPRAFRQLTASATTALFCAVCLISPPAFAKQAPSDEHSKHHPGQAQTTNSDPGQNAEPKGGGGMMGGGGMGGGGMGGGGMEGMMEKMGAPKPKDLYPRLMDLPDLPLEEREEIMRAAHQRMLDGEKLLADGLDDLSSAKPSEDFRRMREAATKIREGLARFESGLAAHRALAEGKAPRNVALRWFKREMNLLQPAAATTGWTFFGMTPFHTSIMLLLILFTGTMVAMYFFKMRRAAALLQKLASAQPTNAEKPTAAPSAPVQHAKQQLCKLKVARIYQETDEVKTFRFVACGGGRLPFDYSPGQFLTVTLPVGEKPIRRSYTISSSPTQAYYCEITVKREDKGIGSRYLHDVVKEGDTLEVKAPGGKFTFSGAEADSVVLIGGGVGITPMMSITRALTDMGWPGEIYFLVACRDPAHFIFRSELDRLEERHPNLHVHVAASRIEQPTERFHQGRLSEEVIAKWVPDITSKWIHLCGAPPMMNATKQLLIDMGVPAERIHTENFGSQKKAPKKIAATEPDANADKAQAPSHTIRFEPSGKTATLEPDETVLEASERIGVDIDNSCRTGSCGACRVKLLSGRVLMECDDALDPDDKSAGMILACQAIASTDVTVETD